MIVAILVTGILAFLTAQDSKKNVFTVGKVDIKLNETKLTDSLGIDPDSKVVNVAENIVPTQEFIKDPTLENVGKNSAWVFVEVSIPTGKAIDSNEYIELFDYEFDEDWKIIPLKDQEKEYIDVPTGVEDIGQHVYYLYYTEPLDPGEETPSVFKENANGNNIVFIDTAGEDLELDYDRLSEAESIDIVINGFACQTELANDVISAEKAWNILRNQEELEIPEAIEPVKVTYYAKNKEDNVAGASTDLSGVDFDEIDGYEVVAYENFFPGSKLDSLYWDNSLATNGYVFDWKEENSNISIYPGMTINENVNVLATYTKADVNKQMPAEYLMFDIYEDHAVFMGYEGNDNGIDAVPGCPADLFAYMEENSIETFDLAIPSSVTISTLNYNKNDIIRSDENYICRIVEKPNNNTVFTTEVDDIYFLDSASFERLGMFFSSVWSSYFGAYDYFNDTGARKQSIISNASFDGEDYWIVATDKMISLYGDRAEIQNGMMRVSGYPLPSVAGSPTAEGLYFDGTDYWTTDADLIAEYGSRCFTKTNETTHKTEMLISGYPYFDVDTSSGLTAKYGVNTAIGISSYIENELENAGYEKTTVYTIRFCSDIANKVYAFDFSCPYVVENLVIPDTVSVLDSVGNLPVYNVTDDLGNHIYNKYIETATEEFRKTTIFGDVSDEELRTNEIANTTLKSIVFPYNLQEVVNGAISCCAAITTVEIPNSITAIYDDMFVGCHELNHVEIPDGTKTIGADAFRNCSYLESIDLKNVESIGVRCFTNCTSLSNIVWSDNLTSIPEASFQGCTSLTTVKLPGKITSIGEYAFGMDTGITSMEFPGVTNIKAYGCCACTNLNDFYAPKIQSIEANAFTSAPVKYIYLGKGVGSIPNKAFDSYYGSPNVYYEGTSSEFAAISKPAWFAKNVSYEVTPEAFLAIEKS